MNFSMWFKALRTIPSIDKEEWDELDIISRWLIATRAAVLVMSLLAAIIPGMQALRTQKVDYLTWALLIICLVFAHATGNLVNDLIAYRRGVTQDTTFRTLLGPQGLMTDRETYTFIAVTGGIALAAGILLLAQRGWLVLALMAIGVLFMLFYTYPLKRIGLGELAVLIIWGPLMVGGGYFVLTGQWDWSLVLASIPYGLAPTTVLLGKHIDQLDHDRAGQVRTIPVLIGERASRLLVRVLFAIQYLLILYIIVTGFFTRSILAVFIAAFFLMRPARLYITPRPTEKPQSVKNDTWPLWFSPATFNHARAYGLFFIVGLILEILD